MQSDKKLRQKILNGVSSIVFILLSTSILSNSIAYGERPSKTGLKNKSSLKKKRDAAKDKASTEESVVEGEEGAVTRYPGTSDVHVTAKQAIIMDVTTGKILLEKNADVRMTPSSMSKMMTSYVIEKKIMAGELNLETEFPVSEKAWRMGGSKMFVPLNGMVKLSDLLRGIIIVSGNDACIVSAEGIAGSEENFATLLNQEAEKMGLTNTHFMNASGWPQDGHYSTARDLALLGMRVVQDHPDFYPLYSEKEFIFGTDNRGRPIKQGNRNPLLYKGETSCDGIKTGHTDDGGYGVTASFVDNGQRYVMVINGLKTMQQRANEARKLLHWTRENFINKKLYKKGEVIEPAASVWLGVKETIPLVLADDVNVLALRTASLKPDITLNFDSPIPAPVKQGDAVGKVVIKVGDMAATVTVLAGEDCEKVGFLTRMWRSFAYLLWGKG